jgi:hypothetical protein
VATSLLTGAQTGDVVRSAATLQLVQWSGAAWVAP